MRVAESSQLQLDKHKEDWMSGLNQQFTKLSTGKTVREFESHILRKLRSRATIICAVQNNDHREYILHCAKIVIVRDISRIWQINGIFQNH